MTITVPPLEGLGSGGEELGDRGEGGRGRGGKKEWVCGVGEWGGGGGGVEGGEVKIKC